jgi:peptidoglycan hydrolase-like protein with peptidoglycan-binding domain
MLPLHVSANHTTAHTLADLQLQLQILLSQVNALTPTAAPISIPTTPSSIIPTTTASSCPAFTQTLYRGKRDTDTGGEVTKLQQFLASDSSIYPEREVTGYFGALTERAVQRWQTAHSVVSSGTPDTTGYGVIGPKTRIAISQKCKPAEIIQNSTPPTIVPIVSPKESVLATATPPMVARNIPPSISSVTGPTSLLIDAAGIWTVIADDDQFDTLIYQVSWGDSISPKQKNGVFSHSYTKVGTYTATFMVTDIEDRFVFETRTIVVTKPAPDNSPPAITSTETSGTLSVGEAIVFTWKATDPNSDNIVWAISWGDGTTTGVVCSGTNKPDTNTVSPVGWERSFEHVYTSAGTYNVTATVSDCKENGTKSAATSHIISAPTSALPGKTNQYAAAFEAIKRELLNLSVLTLFIE